MAKGKDVRVRVILECTSYIRKCVNKESSGLSRYITQKNRHNTLSRWELRKFCPYCCKHTIHGEIKKYIEPEVEGVCATLRSNKNKLHIIYRNKSDPISVGSKMNSNSEIGFRDKE